MPSASEIARTMRAEARRLMKIADDLDPPKGRKKRAKQQSPPTENLMRGQAPEGKDEYGDL